LEQPVIKVENVTVRFNMTSEKIDNIETRLPIDSILQRDDDGYDIQPPESREYVPEEPVNWFNWWVKNNMSVELRQDFRYRNFEFRYLYEVENFQQEGDENAQYIVCPDPDAKNQIFVFPNPRVFYDMMSTYEGAFDFGEFLAGNSQIMSVAKPALLRSAGDSWFGATKGKIEKVDQQQEPREYIPADPVEWFNCFKCASS